MLTPPALYADYAGFINISDRSELRLRTTQQPSQPITGGVDAYTQPLLTLRLTDRIWDCTFFYSASLTATDLQLGGTFELLQSGHAGIGVHTRKTTFHVSEDVTYGQYNSQNVGPGVPAAAPGLSPVGTPNGSGAAGTGTGTATTTTLQTLPQPTTITTFSSTTAADVSYRADRHTTLGLSGAYFVSGGANAASQAVLPEQYGPAGNAFLGDALSRRVTVRTSLRAQGSQLTNVSCAAVTGIASQLNVYCRPQNQLYAMTEGVFYILRRSTTLSADAGVALVRNRIADAAPYVSSVYPDVSANVTWRYGHDGLSALSIAANDSPLLNPLTGSAIAVVSLQAALLDRVTPIVTLRASGGAGQSIPSDDPAAATVVHAEVEADFSLSKRVELAFGERGFWQRQALVPTSTTQTSLVFSDFFSTFTYVAVTLRAPELRF